MDVGCGTGATLLHLNRFARGVGIDLSWLALTKARTRGPASLIQGAADGLPFAPATFHLVTLLDVLEHLENEAPTLHAIRRVLKSGGALLLTVPAYPSLWSQHDMALGHYRRYQADQLRAVLTAAGFRIERLTYAISAMLPATFVFRWLQNRLTAPTAPKTALIRLPPPLNRFLISLLTVESVVLRAVSLPFGVSLLCHAVNEDRT